MNFDAFLQAQSAFLWLSLRHCNDFRCGRQQNPFLRVDGAQHTQVSHLQEWIS